MWIFISIHLFSVYPLQTLQKTRTGQTSNAIWGQKFEFDEIGDGEHLKVKCYSGDMFGDENIGSARVNLEGLVEGSLRDVWIPLEKVSLGELRLQIEAVRVDNYDGSQVYILSQPCQRKGQNYLHSLHCR